MQGSSFAKEGKVNLQICFIGMEIGINFVRCFELTRCIREREVNMLKNPVKEGLIFLSFINYKFFAEIMIEIMENVMHKVVLDD